MKFCHLVQDQKFQIGSDLIWHYPARAKRAGPKGLRAERARAVTGRREDFLSRQQDFFTETAVTSERKVEKSFPRSEINPHGEG